MELISGSLFIRPNIMKTFGYRTPRHFHNFDHTTFLRLGWILGRVEGDKSERIFQLVSPEYIVLRNMMLKYEPWRVKKPVRFPDTKDESGRKEFNVQFVNMDEQIPLGSTEIELDKTALWFELIEANKKHEFVCLSDFAVFDCTYSHREPQGNVVQHYNGWSQAYE